MSGQRHRTHFLQGTEPYIFKRRLQTGTLVRLQNHRKFFGSHCPSAIRHFQTQTICPGLKSIITYFHRNPVIQLCRCRQMVFIFQFIIKFLVFRIWNPKNYFSGLVILQSKRLFLIFRSNHRGFIMRRHKRNRRSPGIMSPGINSNNTYIIPGFSPDSCQPARHRIPDLPGPGNSNPYRSNSFG